MVAAAGLDRLPTTFTAQEATAVGVARSSLRRWAAPEGPLVELSRGVYRRRDAPESAHIALLAVAKRVPKGVICLLSALDAHELTDDVPQAVQIAIPRTSSTPKIDYPAVETFRFDPKTFGVGRSTLQAAPGETVPIYDPARSVVDAIRLRSRVGESLAFQALRRYLNRLDAKPAVLIDYARQLDVEGPVRRAAEVILS